MRLQFVLSEIFIGLRRNLSMTISVILVTFVSLTFVGAGALLQLQIGKMKDDWYDKVEVAIYLCPDHSEYPNCPEEVTDEQREALLAELESEDLERYVQQVYYESPEDAYEALLSRSDAEIWRSLTPDQMQGSFRVKLVNPEEYEVVHDIFSGRPGVEQVRDQREILEPLFRVLNRVTLMSVGIAGIMLLAAVLLITTTIRLSALSRRRETGIMRLVGASALFIQLPFMLEGALAATVGALLAIGGLWAGVEYLLVDWLASEVQFVDYVGASEVWLIAPILLVIAITLAAISSVVSLSRYTRV